MRKAVLSVLALVLTISVPAMGWDVLGHAFIMEQIKGGAQNARPNEVYGITSPDFVNYLIGTPYFEWLYGQTHTNFLRVWNQAETPAEKALAMGFVAHNGLWGADFPAHVSALTLADHSKGYIVARAEMLEQVLGGIGLWTQLGIDGEPYYPLRLELCHNIIEYVVDIQVWSQAQGIGGRVAAAAAARDAGIQRLVKTAYAGLFTAYSRKTVAPLNQPAALYVLQTYESAFQMRVVTYAGIFMANDLPTLVTNLGLYLSALANQVFGLQIPPAQVEQILYFVYLQSGLTDDAMSEIGATVNYVRDQLAAHNIVYGGEPLMLAKPASLQKQKIGE